MTSFEDFDDFEEYILEPEEWEVGNLQPDICICAIPSTEHLIQCFEKTCPVSWYHRQCVGLQEEVEGDRDSDDWKCDLCIENVTQPLIRQSK